MNAENKTIFYVTHHMEEAVYADRILVFNQGKVILDGSPSEIFTHTDKLYEIGLDIPESVWFSRQFHARGWDLPQVVLTAEELIAALPAYQGIDDRDPVHSSAPAGEEIIQVENVHYTYQAGTPLARRALQGASMDAIKGQAHGIAGTNGSGKSTLLQHLNGILRPEKGRVAVNTMVVSDPKTPLREVIKKVGLVFQNPETQFFEIFVGDEIAYGPKQFDLPDLRHRVSETMNLVGLDFNTYKDRRLETLSGGEKRKVALASTLILDPEILLFDEPTAGMDPQAREDLMALFRDLMHQGKTLVIASHRLDELGSIAERISLMESGQVIQNGFTCEILMDDKKLSQAGLAPPLAARLSLALIEQGWPLSCRDTATPTRLMKALKELTR